MRQAWTIALMQMRLIASGRAVLLVFLALPLLFTALIGGVLSSATGGSGSGDSSTAGAPAGRVYPVAIVDRDQSFVSTRLAAELAANPALKVVPAEESDLTKLFADAKLDSAIIIPAGLQAAIVAGTEPAVELVVPPGGNPQVGVGPVVRRYAVRIAQDYLLARIAAERGGSTSEAAVAAAYDQIVADREKASVGLDYQTASRPQTKSVPGGTTIGEFALGFATTFVMMMVFMMAGFILQERQQGTWARLLTAPASRTAVLGGYLLAFFLTGMFQFVMLILFTSLLFHVSWGPLVPLLVVAAAFVLTSTGAGLFLAGIVKTPEQQNALGVLFVTATSMLGGVYWPLDMVGNTMRRIGYLTPQAWAMDGFREVVLRGAAWANLTWPLAVLLGLAIIFLTAGIFRIRYE